MNDNIRTPKVEVDTQPADEAPMPEYTVHETATPVLRFVERPIDDNPDAKRRILQQKITRTAVDDATGLILKQAFLWRDVPLVEES